METVQILEKAEKLAQLVMKSEIGENYFFHLNKLKNDSIAQQKIKTFSSLKDLYEEVQRFGKYHPDYKKVNLEIRKAKRDMDLYETISNFKQAEMELQTILDEISIKVGRAVSDEIKIPTGSPFFESASGCSGGCGTGGACGCS